jgi:hypothetical protein
MTVITQGYGPAGSPSLVVGQGYAPGAAVVNVSDNILGAVSVLPAVAGLVTVLPALTGVVTVNPGRGS